MSVTNKILIYLLWNDAIQVLDTYQAEDMIYAPHERHIVLFW